MLVIRLFARKHQAQGDESEVGRAGSQKAHPLIKWRRAGRVGRLRKQRLDDVSFRTLTVKKIPVDELELHIMGFAVRFAMLCAVILGTAGVSRSDDFGQLLDRMRTRMGPVWRTHLISTSHLTVDGVTASVQTDAEDLRFETRQCTGTLCIGTYFDGRRLFNININGTTLPRSTNDETYLRGVRTISSFMFLAPDFTANGGRLEDDGAATIDGVRYRMLLVQSTGADPMQVFVDLRTGLVRFFRDVNDDDSFEYRDYHLVDGMMLPYNVLRNGATLERYDTRGGVQGAFAEPHGLTPTIGTPELSVPTDPDKTTPVFACSIAGIDTKCLLDTGNSGLSMSLELAEQLNAPSVGAFQVHGLGRYATEVVRTGPLRVGNVTFPNANYVVLHDVHRFGYDVVLGADVLAATNVLIDQKAHVVWFGARAANDGVTVPLTFENFVPVVDVRLGELEAQLAVDTGDESNINLSYDFYSRHRDLFSATEQRTVSGVGGSSVELIGRIPNVRIGDLSIEDQRIGATQLLQGTAFGHLGAAFLENFRVILDYSQGKLQLVPGTNAPTH